MNNKFLIGLLVVFIISVGIVNKLYKNKKNDDEFELIQDSEQNLEEELKRLMILNN
tara:strand:- start:162 stop:329 length:168 start_codon:yes stop_codon:yes gene_type:complete